MSDIKNDNNGKNLFNWSSKRNNEDRLRHRPHIINKSNSRGSANTRYFSSVDADIYFGDVFVDEVANIAWSVQQNAMPIFGYNSFCFDDIAMGTRIVQGQFAINFTQSNYLNTVLSTMKKINRKMYGSDIPVTSRFTEQDKKRRNTPIWDAGFDILVGYGEKSNDAYEQIVMLDCCQITGCSQQLDYNGEPVMEVYSFIARDMKFTTIATSNPTPEEEETPEEIPDRSDPFVVVNSKGDPSSSGFINIKDSNNLLAVNYKLHDFIEKVSLVGAYITLNGTGIPEFNTQKTLKIDSSSVTYTITDKEKSEIKKYCDKYSTNEISATLVYALSYNGDTINREKKLNMYVTL